MIGEILFLFFSLSFRSAYLPDVPMDYEIKGGLESKEFKSSVLFERENGLYYWGVDLKYAVDNCITLNTKKTMFVYGTEFVWYKKDAKDIDYQSIRVLNDIGENVKIGLSLNANRWREPLPMMILKADYGLFKYSMETNLWNRAVASIDISKKYKVEYSKVYIMPILKYRFANGNEFWQAKIEVGWKL